MPYKDPEKARENAKQRSAAYRARNKEKIKQAARTYYEQNADARRAYSSQWYKDNPDKAHALRSSRRARLQECEATPYLRSEVLALYGTDCHLCGGEIDLEAPGKPGMLNWEKSLHLDHVTPLACGGADTIENVRPSHGLCNVRKNKYVEGTDV